MPRARPSPYAVHPTVAYACAVVANLKTRTGRSADEWVALLLAEGPEGTKQRKAWLKSSHGLGLTSGTMIVDRAEGRGAVDTVPEAYLAAAPGHVEAQYAGAKQALRPLYDALLGGALKRHPDLAVCPCKTIVPCYRAHVVAHFKPTTRTRIDVGLALKGAKGRLPRRLIPTGGLEKGDRITHRIAVSVPGDIDELLWDWFAAACELDGPGAP